MPLLSASTLLRSLSIFHLTLAYYFLTSPSTIADQNMVFVLGAAMDLPSPAGFLVPSAPLSLLAAVLMLLGLSDLTASGLPEGPFSEYWSGQAGVRVAFFFGVTGLSFLLGPSSGGVRGSGWDGLKNRIVFSWGFLEMMVWFWIFVTLREERRDLARRMAERKQADEDRL